MIACINMDKFSEHNIETKKGIGEQFINQDTGKLSKIVKLYCFVLDPVHEVAL